MSRRGSAILVVLVLVALLAGLGSLLIRAAAQGLGAHRAAKRSLGLQRAVKAARARLEACLLDNWRSGSEDFGPVFSSCASGLSPLVLNGVSYQIEAAQSGEPPFDVRITATDNS